MTAAFDLSEDDELIALVATAPAKEKPFPWWIVIAIGFALFLAYQRFNPPSPGPTPDPDDVVIVDDEKTQPQPQPPMPDGDKIDLKDTTLIFVLENSAPTAAQTEIMLSVTTESLVAIGMKGFRRYDEEQPEVKQLVDFAMSKQISSPLIAIVRDKKPPIFVAEFPKTKETLWSLLK